MKFTTHSSRSPYIQLTNFIKPPPLVTTNKHKHRRFIKVIGSVNGLICFYTSSHMHIWNPSLSALTEIPHFTGPDYDYEYICRFGFDPKNDDYKVFVATFCIFGDYDNIVTESMQVEVYSVRKGLWESISVKFPSHITCLCNYGDDVADGYDGHLHWICYADPSWGEQTLLAFDLGAGTFTEISLPDSIRFGCNFLGVLSQKLCVISQDSDVWVMDTYGVAKSWVKQLHVFDERVNLSFVPHGFTLSNEFLCELDDDDDLALCYSNTNTVVIKLFNMRNIKGRDFKIVRHVDSLVWPVVATSRHAASLQSI